MPSVCLIRFTFCWSSKCFASLFYTDNRWFIWDGSKSISSKPARSFCLFGLTPMSLPDLWEVVNYLLSLILSYNEAAACDFLLIVESKQGEVTGLYLSIVGTSSLSGFKVQAVRLLLLSATWNFIDDQFFLSFILLNWSASIFSCSVNWTSAFFYAGCWRCSFSKLFLNLV